jgi:hypothetical protein
MKQARVGTGVALLLVGVAASAPAFAQPAGYEAPPVQSASKIAPAALLSGPRFKVQDEAPTDGFMPRFTIQSDFGQYVVNGHEMLAVRVQEIAALDKLEEISKTEAFAGAMAASAKKTGKAVANVVTNPKETAEGIPKGVGRFFKGVGKKAEKAGSSAVESVKDDDDEEDVPGQTSTSQKAGEAAKSVTGASKAKRQLAKKFQVDPYSNNAALQKKLDDLAMAMTAGGMAMSVVNPIPLTSTVASVNGLVWDTPAPGLRDLNDKKLAALGVTDKTRKALFANSFFTPSQQTGFVTALAALQGVTGADAAVALAARRARSEDDARFFRRAAEVLAQYQKQAGPLAKLEARKSLFVAHARSGAFVVPAAVDSLIWMENVDQFSAEPVPGAKTREVWLSGEASPKAKAELQSRGWVVKEHVLGTGGR